MALPPPPPLAQRLSRVHSTHCGDRNCKQPEHMLQSTAPYALGASFAVKRHDLCLSPSVWDGSKRVLLAAAAFDQP